MTTVFLYTFFVGFGLTLASLLLGIIDVGGDAGHGHLPHGKGGNLHTGHVDNPHVYGDTSAVSPVNFQSLVGFMMGFGGVGYVVTKVGLGTLIVTIPVAVVGGAGVGWLVFKWLRLLQRGERPLGATSHMGTVGRLTVGIREGGTGELVYTNHGTFSVASARSADGASIEKGEVVVVLRYEKGIAYVQPLKAFMAKDDQ